MSRRLVWWVTLGAALELGVAAGSVRAEGPMPDNAGQPPTPVYNMLHGSTPNGMGGRPMPFVNMAHHRLPLGCWADPHGYSCSSFASESTFIFGSCRAFYAEPCLPGRPPQPWELPGSAYDPASTNGQPRCNCGIH